MPQSIEQNRRRYRLPRRPAVVVCVDGCDPAYIEDGFRRGIIPTIASFRDTGFVGTADSAMPSFTNPNNVSIVTGVPPAVHGIAGNYYLDRATGREVMVTDAALLRGGTILAAMARAGVSTAAITAKDKLRKLLGHELAGIRFSSEYADQCSLAENGITDVEALVGRRKPDMYSADLSLFVLDAGIRLLEQGRAVLQYLSLSDYVQHGHAPGEPESDAFLQAVDARVARLVALGAVVGLVADHGMNDKARPDGSPNVIFLEDVLNQRFGPGAVRVICPITDPFVRHHGALGSFVRVYRRGNFPLVSLMDVASGLPGVSHVLDAATAAARLELPLDREGDFVVLGDANTVIGSTRGEHDLSGLAGHRLRSHGGLAEQAVPFIVSGRLSADWQRDVAGRRLHNFDIFDAVLNGVE